MSVLEWINHIVIDGLKYIIIARYFFGYELQNRRVRIPLIIYFFLLPLIEGVDVKQIEYLFRMSWKFLLILCLFKGKVIGKIKGVFAIWFLITIVDTSIIVPFSIFLNIDENGIEIITVIGCIGLFLWVILAWKAIKLRNNIIIFWKSLTLQEYILLMIVLFIISFIMGGIQGNLYSAITMSEKELTFLAGIVAMLIFVFICILLFLTRRSREKLRELNQLNISYMDLQKRYYEDSLKQYEDMRRFRHDINHHIYVLSQLSRRNKVMELKEYINGMAENYEAMRGIHTGNFIADCIVNHSITDLREDEKFSFEIDGKFPEKVFIETMDFCILLSNVFENAREALEKVVGKKVLQLEIKYYRQWLYIIVRNTTDEQEIDFSKTSKMDTTAHGYGTQNIRRIVEKYEGSVQWQQEGSMVEVKMKFAKKEMEE